MPPDEAARKVPAVVAYPDGYSTMVTRRFRDFSVARPQHMTVTVQIAFRAQTNHESAPTPRLEICQH